MSDSREHHSLKKSRDDAKKREENFKSIRGKTGAVDNAKIHIKTLRYTGSLHIEGDQIYTSKFGRWQVTELPNWEMECKYVATALEYI